MGAFRRRWPGLSYGRGEDWHYVGDTGEPAFESGWSNAVSGSTALAFRLRAGGQVDMAGVVTTAGPAAEVFYLPEGYRPTASAYVSYIRRRSATVTAQLLSIENSGAVAPNDIASGDVVFIYGSFFVIPPDGAP